VSVPGDYFSGSVGSPCLCAKLKLVDVPEKNYFSKDGKGEVCVKGTCVFKGNWFVRMQGRCFRSVAKKCCVAVRCDF